MKILKYLSNIPGWRTSRKIVVFESDDWGSIRMPSKRAANKLEGKGLDMGTGVGVRMNKFDTLASHEDLETLFEVLRKYQDSKGLNPVFTAVSLTSNPDFEKIKKANFNKYYHEPFTETLKHYNQESAIKLWKEGLEKRLFVPEFHGREHLNVGVWMRRLQSKDTETLIAFDEGVWGFNKNLPFGLNYQAAFDVENVSDLDIQKEVISSGVKIFKRIHGYTPSFFVPPNGPFNNSLEKVSSINGIKFMSGSKIQKEPQGNGLLKRRIHYLGQKNRVNQIYITRNCFFEPNIPGLDWVGSCLNEIKIAFKLNKPAIISTHRVNFIGGLDPNNRKKGIQKLNELLNSVIAEWPEVEFMSTSELGEIIKSDSRK